VLAIVDRNHVGICIDVLVKRLRIAIVRTKSLSAVVKTDPGYTGEIHADIVSTPSVPCAELMEHGWAEGMDVTELEIGRCHLRRIKEATKVVKAPDVLIRRPCPVDLAEQPIFGTNIDIKTQRGFVTIEQVSLHLRLIDADRLFHKRIITAECAGLR